MMPKRVRLDFIMFPALAEFAGKKSPLAFA